MEPGFSGEAASVSPVSSELWQRKTNIFLIRILALNTVKYYEIYMRTTENPVTISWWDDSSEAVKIY